MAIAPNEARAKRGPFGEPVARGPGGESRIHDGADGGAEVVGEVQLEVDALVTGGPEAGDAGEFFVFEELLQGVELELGRVALQDADPAGLDFEPLEGDTLDELGHGRIRLNQGETRMLRSLWWTASGTWREKLYRPEPLA